MKAKVERAWIQTREDHGVEMYEVVVRVDIKKGRFIESVHRERQEAQARIEDLLHSDILVDMGELTPTMV